MQHTIQRSFIFLTISRCWWFDNQNFPHTEPQKIACCTENKNKQRFERQN